MSDEIDTRSPSELAVHSPQRELGQFDVLDVYESGVAPEEARIEALATISAGTMNDKGLPQRSTDGTIYLHDDEGRAPGLKAALKATGFKSLLITFPFDDPRMFIQQRFVQYSKTRLLAYGDQHSITTISEKGVRTEYDAVEHPDEYKAAVLNCKTAFSVYFNLIEWENGVPMIVMPDGMGFYRIRFTGRNSARSFMGQLRLLAKFTEGRLAGIPFDLRIVNRSVADSEGVKRTIPVFVPTVKAQGMRLDSSNFRGVLQEGIGQAQALRLAPPREETMEDAAPSADMDALALDDGQTVTIDQVEGGAAEPDEHDIARLQSHLDYDTERNRFFAAVGGTRFDTDEARADLLGSYFGPDDDGNHPFPWAENIDTSSLREVLPRVAPNEWDDFLAWVDTITRRDEVERQARDGNADPGTYGDDVTERHVEWLEGQIARLEQQGLRYEDRLPFIAWALDMPIAKNADLTAELFMDLRDVLGIVKSNGAYQPLSDRQLAEKVATFTEARTSDGAAQDALGI